MRTAGSCTCDCARQLVEQPGTRFPGGNRLAAAIGLARSELLQSFFDEMGDGLSRARRTDLEQLGDRYPRLLNAHSKPRIRQTLAHGDTHFWNFLYPNDPNASPILIDWQACLVQFGAWDLAYMIGLQFDLEHRRHRERSLLDAYLLTLHERGIDYRHDDLLYDYRLHDRGLGVRTDRATLQWRARAGVAVLLRTRVLRVRRPPLPDFLE